MIKCYREVSAAAVSSPSPVFFMLLHLSSLLPLPAFAACSEPVEVEPLEDDGVGGMAKGMKQ